MHNNEDKLKDDYQLKPKKKSSKTIFSILITALLGLLNFSKLAVIGKLLFTLLKASKFAGTFISMGVTVVLYAQFYGWLFALGFVAVIFVHEMGHYVTSKRLGLDVSAPTFIPFLGAFIKMKTMPKSVREEAITAIGGPLAGAFITLVCIGLYILTNNHYWAGLAYLSAFINLFNLLPFGSLDGGRISKAISPFIWVIGLVMALFLIWKLHAYILLIIVFYGIYEVFTMYQKKSETAQYLFVEPSFRLKIGFSYLLLIAALAILMIYSLDISKSFTDSLYR